MDYTPLEVPENLAIFPSLRMPGGGKTWDGHWHHCWSNHMFSRTWEENYVGSRNLPKMLRHLHKKKYTLEYNTCGCLIWGVSFTHPQVKETARS